MHCLTPAGRDKEFDSEFRESEQSLRVRRDSKRGRRKKEEEEREENDENTRPPREFEDTAMSDPPFAKSQPPAGAGPDQVDK